MSRPFQDLKKFVYRRITPSEFKSNSGVIAPKAFIIQPNMRGLSVYRADITSPYQVLQECIDNRKRQLNHSDVDARKSASDWLIKNPSVESLLQKGWREVVISIEAIYSLGFNNFEGPEPNGHINVLGTAEQFEAQAEKFIELIDRGQARILTIEECLERPDIK